MSHINQKNYHDLSIYLNSFDVKISSNFENNDTFFGINSLNKANNNEITFFSNDNIDTVIDTEAKACLINKDKIPLLPSNCEPIIVENPYKAFACLTNLFSEKQKSNGVISKYSNIFNNVQIDDNVQIDSFSNLLKDTTIKKNVIIESNCTIGSNVIIGENTIIKSNTKLSNCIIGNNCVIKSGAVIGGSGFGFDEKSKIQIQHCGNVIIKDNCHIGSNTTIDRAVFESTLIGENSHIDNLVQIAHNVIIGKNAIIAAQVGIAGSSKIGNNLKIGGQSGIAGHLIIGNNVTIAAKSGVTKNLIDNSIVAGFPAMNLKKWKLSNIKFNKLK